VLIGQRIARGHSRERAGHVEPGRCRDAFCLLDHPLSDRCELLGPAIVQLFRRRLCVGQSAAGLDSDTDQRPKTDPAQRGEQRVLVSAISCVRYPRGCNIAARAS
jgi:hypothetical protein